ncbi:AlpA family phage regulatory protein [Saccharospirillum alexandrii]|uniref:AlpA family phage regulatory protein n=1 Tax=Saccharospirillum alexandrii TaxID=2448477 RepID=UPI0037359333
MRIIRLKEVIKKTGLARSRIYKHLEQAVSPRPVPRSGWAVYWVESEINGWVEELFSARG